MEKKSTTSMEDILNSVNELNHTMHEERLALQNARERFSLAQSNVKRAERLIIEDMLRSDLDGFLKIDTAALRRSILARHRHERAIVRECLQHAQHRHERASES